MKKENDSDGDLQLVFSGGWLDKMEIPFYKTSFGETSTDGLERGETLYVLS